MILQTAPAPRRETNPRKSDAPKRPEAPAAECPVNDLYWLMLARDRLVAVLPAVSEDDRGVVEGVIAAIRTSIRRQDPAEMSCLLDRLPEAIPDSVRCLLDPV